MKGTPSQGSCGEKGEQ
jgi:hypothetical protein